MERVQNALIKEIKFAKIEAPYPKKRKNIANLTLEDLIGMNSETGCNISL